MTRWTAVPFLLAFGCASEAGPTVDLTVVSVDLLPTVQIPPQAGNEFLSLSASVHNGTDGSLPLAFPFFRVRTPSGVEYVASPATELSSAGCGVDVFLAPGGSHVCDLVFEMAQSVLPEVLTYEGDEGYRAEAILEICGADKPNLCDRRCVDWATDSAHCGACDRAVPDNNACVDGMPECGAPRQNCGGACVDTRSHPDHCGDCGVAVDSASSCVDGEPQCDSDLERCNGSCIRTSEDPKNCGGCGIEVPAGEICVAGGAACASAAVRCDGVCVDIDSDPDNCGDCGRVCFESESLPSEWTRTCVQGQLCFVDFEDDIAQSCKDSCESLGFSCAGSTSCPGGPSVDLNCIDLPEGNCTPLRGCACRSLM